MSQSGKVFAPVGERPLKFAPRVPPAPSGSLEEMKGGPEATLWRIRGWSRD